MASNTFFLKVKIVEVLSPVTFLALRNPVDDPRQPYSFKDFSDHINTYYSQYTILSDSRWLPKHEQLVVARHPKDRTWYRARVLSIVERSHGYNANIYLVDKAENLSVPITSLQDIKDEFLELPFQAIRLTLPNIYPQTYILNKDCTQMEYRVSSKWDTAARSFSESVLIKPGRQALFEVTATQSQESFLGKLYVEVDGHERCFNEVLVEKNYATLNSEEEFELESLNGSRDRDYLEETPDDIPIGAAASNYCGSAAGSSKSSQSAKDKWDNLVSDMQSKINNLLSDVNEGSFSKTQKPCCTTDQYKSSNGSCCSSSPRNATSPNSSMNTSVGTSLNSASRLSQSSEGRVAENHKGNSNSPSFSASQKKLLLSRIKESLPSHAELRNKENDTCSYQVQATVKAGVAIQAVKVPSASPSSTSSSKSVNSDVNRLKAFVYTPSSHQSDRSRYLFPDCENQSYEVGVSKTANKDINMPCTRPKLHFFDGPIANPSFSTSMNERLGVIENATVRKILVLGEAPPKPWISLPILFDHIGSGLEQLHITKPRAKPSLIQSYVWPAVVRGRSFAAISVPHSGKTLAYLLPLLSSIVERSRYINLPSGNQPLALVITASWKTASRIEGQCKMLLRGTDITALSAYGGGRDESQQIPLLNGCDVLVATPCAVIRLLKGNGLKCLELNRLCHLIFEDADILFDQFIDQIKEVLAEFACVLKNRKSDTFPHQIMAFSCKWTQGLKTFFCEVIPRPLLYCSSFCESIVIAGVKTFATIFEVSRKAKMLLDMLRPNLDYNDQKIIICTCEAESAKELYHCLRSCQWILLAHECLSSCEVRGIASQWRQCHPAGQKPILIVSDPCLDELNISDADRLIHYDIPEMSKSQFGFRFGSLLSHMDKFKPEDLKGKISLTSNCEAHIIITEKCKLQAHALIRLLTRLASEIPPQLLSLAFGFYQACEENKEVYSFCHYIKAFGTCPHQSWCMRRHLLAESMDHPSSTLFRESLVKVFVTHVHSASHFYGRIIKYQDDNGQWTLSRLDSIPVNLGLNLHYADPKNRVVHQHPKVGDVCAVINESDCYFRVRILSRPHKNVNDGKDVRVMFIDVGTICQVSVAGLLKLPQDLSSIPPLVMEMYLCDVRPVDMDSEWTDVACDITYGLIYGKELVGKVALSLGNTLWLSSLVYEVVLPLSNVIIPKYELKKVLLEENFAVADTSHLQKLEILAQKMFALPTIQKPPHSPVKATKKMSLPQIESPPELAYLQVGEFADVHMSELFSPHRFFVIKVNCNDSLDDLMDEIQKHIKGNSMRLRGITEGMLCIAKFSKNEEYHRGRILSDARQSGTVDVFFVDYGFQEEVRTSDIYPLPHNFIWRLPFQAILCGLADVAPADGSDKWSKEVSDFMWNESWTETQEPRQLLIKALKKSEELDPKTGTYYYSVQLFDDQKPDDDIRFSARLCSSGYARLLDLASVNDVVEEQSLTSSCSLENFVNDCSVTDDMSKTDDLAQVASEIVKKVIPYVCWRDSKTDVVLTLKIAEVKTGRINVSPGHIYYTTTVANTVNELDINLFDEVNHEKFEVKVSDSAVVIRLLKVAQTKWPRLTKNKFRIKPYWLSADFDKLDYSSDDSNGPPPINWQQQSSAVQEKNCNNLVEVVQESFGNPEEYERLSSTPTEELSSSDESCDSLTAQDHFEIFN